MPVCMIIIIATQLIDYYKNGEYSYVYSRGDTVMYYTPEEFSEFVDGVFQANDNSSKPQGCYQ